MDDKMKAKMEELQKVMFEISSKINQAAAQQEAPEGGEPSSGGPSEDNVVDADYTVIDDEEK